MRRSKINPRCFFSSLLGPLLAWGLSSSAPSADCPIQQLELFPKSILLAGSRSQHRLMATGTTSAGATRDLTGEVEWSSADPAVVQIHFLDSEGKRPVVVPVGDGKTRIQLRWKSPDQRAFDAEIAVEVKELTPTRPPRFTQD